MKNKYYIINLIYLFLIFLFKKTLQKNPPLERQKKKNGVESHRINTYSFKGKASKKIEEKMKDNKICNLHVQ